MGSVFIAIIIGSIVGLCFVLVVRNRIQEIENASFEKKIVERLLVISQLHIMYACIIYGYICSITPELMPEDQTVRSFFQDHELIGGIVEELTGTNLNPDIDAIHDRVQMGKTYGLIFMIILIVLASIEGIGLVNRRINRWVIEAIAIVTSIGCYFCFQYAVDLQKEVMSNSTILQLTDITAGFLGVGGFSSMFINMFEFAFWIILLALFINHLLYHRALNKYYTSNR